MGAPRPDEGLAKPKDEPPVGLDLTRYLRENWRGPVIIVSGRGDSVDRVVGLELGADDYVSKPFDLRELLARVRSVLRRSGVRVAAAPEAAPSRIRFAGFILDYAARLQQLDTSGIPPTSSVLAPHSTLREDVPAASLPRQETGPSGASKGIFA